MGRFQTLSQVGLVIANIVESAVPANTDVRIGVPLDDPSSSSPAVRISLMWTTPQAGHRNDPPERNPDGSMAQPLPTLSLWFVISTYGVTQEGNAIGAHDLLGQIIRAFHARPRLELPIDNLGEGRVNAVQPPVDAELSEKLWGMMHLPVRPWMLLDVGPVQLIRTEPAGPPQPLVHPGGVRLLEIDVAEPARIERYTPDPVSEGGRIRIDGTYTGAATRVGIGATAVTPPALVEMEPGGPLSLTLPGAAVAGAYDLRLTGTGTAGSDAITLTVVDPALPGVDAPATLTHSRVANLVLGGRSLGAGNVEVVFWPDTGVLSPVDVVTLTGNGAVNSVTIAAAALTPLRNILYRISVRHGDHGFTPYVLLEMTA